MWPQTTATSDRVLAGVSQNHLIPCSLSGAGVFWLINGSLYGPLRVPRDFIVCSKASCNLNTLTILVVQTEMNGLTFQCVRVDYHDNTEEMGDVRVLEIITLDNGNAMVLIKELYSHPQPKSAWYTLSVDAKNWPAHLNNILVPMCRQCMCIPVSLFHHLYGKKNGWR